MKNKVREVSNILRGLRGFKKNQKGSTSFKMFQKGSRMFKKVPEFPIMFKGLYVVVDDILEN